MMKYIDTLVSFLEVPDEVSLCINISNCQIRCPDCHSKWLWEDKGTDLTAIELDKLIKENEGITCVCFMGGDSNPIYIEALARHIKDKHKPLKVAWYSGKEDFHDGINYMKFDFVKLGPYIKEKGGLDKETTNQQFFMISPFSSIIIGHNTTTGDITGFKLNHKFVGNRI